jgi:hypothetical protein
MTPRALGVLAALAIGTAPAEAQFTGALDLGAGTTHSDDAVSGAVATLAPSFAFEAGALRLGATGAYSSGPSSRWNFQGSGTAALISPRVGPLALEANGNLGWTWHQQVQGVTTMEGGLRVWAYPSATTAVWAGGSLGTAYSLSLWRPLRRTQIGSAARLGPVRLAVSLTSTAFDVATTPASGPTTTAEADTLAAGGGGGVRRNMFTDGMISGRLTLAAFDLDVALGRRFSRTTPELTLWSAMLSRCLTPGLALVAGAGRTATDPVTSLPGSRYVVLGMRVRFGAPSSRPRPAEEAARPDAGAFRIGPPAPGGRPIRLKAPGARVVELAGDFTDWLPVSLERRGEDEWVGRLPIAPGIHRVAMRVDGGEWRPPPGTRPVPTEFGPDVGEIVVE